MSNTTIRRLIGGLGTALVLLICGVLIFVHFLTGKNLQEIDVRTYTDITRDASGEYHAKLDVDRLIRSEHLYLPTEEELKNHPEIETLRSLDVRVSFHDGQYLMETVSTVQKPNVILKENGIRLINTQWKLGPDEMEAEVHSGEKVSVLDFSAYVRMSRNADGTYTAKMDTRKLLEDAGFDPDSDLSASVGAKALSTIGISATQQGNGYDFQITSSLPSVMDDLKTAGIRYSNVKWTWSEQELLQHIGTVTVPDTPVPDTPVPETPASETPSGTFNDMPDRTPEAEATPAPTDTPVPATPQRNADAIDTLYGFDQTEVRKAIRAAKEKKYGSSIESSEVKYNYFAVGNDTAEHANVFRIVYTIVTSSSTEYLIADVYDLENETGYTASDVHLRVEKNSNTARSTDDLQDYKVYTLSGGSMVFAENKDKSPFNEDGLVMPQSLSEYLTYDELWDIPQTSDLTLLQLLGYARNEMFARAGHKFKDSSNYPKFYKQYSWYKPTGNVSATDLYKKYPKTEKNIERIKFLEKLIKEG